MMHYELIKELSSATKLPTESFTDYDFESLCTKSNYRIDDLSALLLPQALPYLELLAQKASTVTQHHFGRVISLFTPLYISNYCDNSCVYCSFARHQSIERIQLTKEQVENEASQISKTGIRHILVLTGESLDATPFSYLSESLSVCSRHFSSIGIEVYPLSAQEYCYLIESNLIDSLTIYQETYNQVLYRSLHPYGPKSDYFYRLETPDRACSQGLRACTIGALFGLDDYISEAVSLACHINYLQKQYPEVELSVSFPRLRPIHGDKKFKQTISDRQLVQLIVAFRLIFPTIGITLSTRESEKMRNGLIPLGITKMSAGVSTAVGAHSGCQSVAQFDIADQRTVLQVKETIESCTYLPVFHTWNKMLFPEKVQ